MLNEQIRAHSGIGYLFCSELMPADHELQLMLVNTLRKVHQSDALYATFIDRLTHSIRISKALPKHESVSP